MFWSLEKKPSEIKELESMDKKMQATIISQQPCNMFEYTLEGDIPGKIGEAGGIFFDITKVEIICFNTGVCFLMLKTALTENQNFSDVLNFNYKFRDINSKAEHSKQYETIKIQTGKLNNMQAFADFVKKIAGRNLKAKQINLDTDRLITYSYVCLNQASWNENTDINLLEKQFEKYRTVKPACEQTEDAPLKEAYTYHEKYLYYGFSNNTTVLLTCDNNIKNYTTLPFQFENEQLYHFIFNLYKKIYLKITYDEIGKILEKYYAEEQILQTTFHKLKQKYDLLYKDYEIGRNKESNKWIIAIMIIMIIINVASIIFVASR